MFGLMTSPIRMIFSLLLMQGISLTMFRAFLNQAIQRVDPLKFQFNLGNTNQTGATITSGTQPTQSSSLPLFQTLLQHYQQSQQQQQVPTPAPIVDQKVIDLVQFIRAIQPSQQQQQSAPLQSTITMPQAPTVQLLPSPTIMSSPIISLNPNSLLSAAKLIQTTTPSPPALQIPIPTSNYPGGLVMVLSPRVSETSTSSPSYSVSASNHIEKIFHNRIDDNDFEDEDNNNDDEHLLPLTTTPKPNNSEESTKKPRKKSRKRKKQKRSQSSTMITATSKTKADNMIVFEAVGDLPLDFDIIGGDDEN